MTTFDWFDFLTLTWKLACNPQIQASEKALLRTAIGRAYYAVFNIAREFVQDVDGVIVPDNDAHGFLIRYFLNSAGSIQRKIARELEFMRDARNRADYDKRYAELQEDVQRVIQRARITITWIDQI